MPYIKPKDRKIADKVVQAMLKAEVLANGDLNYILFKYCKHHVSPSYNNLKNFCGELCQCATEIERKILAPYEEMKENENGGV